MSRHSRILLFTAFALGLCFLGVWFTRIAEREGSSGSCFLHYSIGSASLRLQTPRGDTRTFADVTSGDNLIASIARKNKGPIPPGTYLVYTRDQGRPTYNGHPAFLLDPVDDQPGNDRIDGFSKTKGGGRFAFRIHAGSETAGCLATAHIEEISEILLLHGTVERFDIYSRPATSGRPGMKRFRETEPGAWEPAPEDGEWELFEQEQRIGLLWVTP